MYKMIVSDLDESLLRDDNTVSPRDVATIHRLKAAGVKFVPNTGRGFASVQPLLATLGTKDQAGQYVISYNGGAIVENAGNRILEQHALPFAAADAIYRLAMAQGTLAAHIYTFHHVFVANLNEPEKELLLNRGVDFEDYAAPDLAAFAHRPIAKVIFQHLDYEVRRRFAEQVAEQVPMPLTVTYSSNRYVEFNPVDIDKGQAALNLGAKIGVKPAEIIALGDNSNDLSMLRQVGMGVAVANAIPAVKRVAKLVLPVTNNEDPITALAAELFK